MRQNADPVGATTNGITMAVVTALSLLLLIYVGFGEATRTFTHFQTEKLAAQGRLLQTTIEQFLRPGLPLEQFVGFRTKAEPIMASDETIASIVAFDRVGNPIFVTDEAEVTPLAAQPEEPNFGEFGNGDIFEIRKDDTTLQVILPLRNRFERVGSLAIRMPLSVVDDRVLSSFTPVLIISAIAAVGFGVLVGFTAPQLQAGQQRRWLQVVYGVIFTAISGIVIATLVSLYSGGAQAKTQGLADSLSQRVASILNLGLNIMEIEGLERVFSDYQRLNPDIHSAGLVVDDVIRIHTNPRAIGEPWTTDPGTFEYVVDLGRSAGRAVRVAVAVPQDIVVRQTARSVKNFAALFLASAFMAGIFLQLAGTIQVRKGQTASEQPPNVTQAQDPSTANERALLLVKPVFFIAVLAEHLTYAFLPQFIHRTAENAGFADGAASFVFTSYFIAFAITLVPAGFFAQRRGARGPIYAGLALACLGMVVLTLLPGFWTVMLARTLSGVGQGLLFIGVQSYILATTGPERRTRGAAIIVYGFQGGMISGMAIGSLLVSQLGTQGVFILSGSLAFVMMIYTLAAVPAVKSSQRVKTAMTAIGSFRSIATDLANVLRNLEFLKAILLIGIPAKAVLTGVVIFSLPLLMQSAGYRQEDIGQVLMIYALAVVVTNAYASRHTDHTGIAAFVLVDGSLLSGLGMTIIGLTGVTAVLALPESSTLPTIMLIVGVVMVGIGHGFINAPVVTHVVNSELSNQIGEAPTSASYRFLERIGHVCGPLLVGQLFAVFGQNPTIIGQLGVAVAVMGLLFAICVKPLAPFGGQEEGVR